MNTKLSIKPNRDAPSNEISYKLAKTFYWVGEAGPITIGLVPSIGDVMSRELWKIVTYVNEVPWDQMPATADYFINYKGEQLHCKLDREYNIEQQGMYIQLTHRQKNGQTIAARRFVPEYVWQQN